MFRFFGGSWPLPHPQNLCTTRLSCHSWATPMGWNLSQPDSTRQGAQKLKAASNIHPWFPGWLDIWLVAAQLCLFWGPILQKFSLKHRASHSNLRNAVSISAEQKHSSYFLPNHLLFTEIIFWIPLIQKPKFWCFSASADLESDFWGPGNE